MAVLAPISWRVPPRHYGPWEQFVSLLTEGLVARGVEVTLFATADSATSARLASTAARGWSEDPERPDTKVAECLHISAVFERSDEFDLIHNSFDFLPLTYSALVSTDVQPTETTINTAAVRSLVDAADAASEVGAELIVTLFVGHMSGVNWAPGWAAGGAGGDRRFRVVAGSGAGLVSGLRNWYSDPGIGDAQERLAVSVASALRGHPAVWMWDLGNENSNCTIPPDAGAGTAWLERMTGAIREADPGRLITVGLHMEDLEDDRRIGPAEVARYCDVVSMHGYPAYTTWACGPADERLLPFLALLTRWLAGGAAVLFEEFGLPTGTPAGTGPDRLVGEDAAADYTGRGLDGLRRAGCLGALLWCFADYAPALHRRPPFDEARHERSFGLWRADGSPKPAVAEITRRAGRLKRPPPNELPWLDLDVGEFLSDRTRQLPRLYRCYCQAEVS